MGSFREHGVLIYLSKDLYLGFIKLQADKSLGRSYAGLLLFTEGLFRMGYISKEVYAEHIKKYSQPLSEEEGPVSTLEEQRALEKKNLLFKGILEQWDLHPDIQWRQKVLADAEKFKDKLETARRLLEIGIVQEEIQEVQP